MAQDQADPGRQRRLGRSAPGRAPRRLGVPIQQCALSRCRRHSRRRTCNGPCAELRRPRQLSRTDRACAGMDSRHAKPQRRLGRIRCRQHELLFEPYSLRGPWRAPRSAHRRCDRTLPLDAGATRRYRRQGPARRKDNRLFARHADGGWGEDGSSYKLKYKGYEKAPSTPAQTAWALLGLMAAGEVDSPAVERGITYLSRSQRGDGEWDEERFTAVGFPRIFYLRYHGYAKFFPVCAMARYRNLKSTNSKAVVHGL